MSSSETTCDEFACNERPFLCTFDGCNASFSKKKKLSRHILKHTGARPFACDIEGCLKTYTNSSHLKRHKKIFHEKFKEEVSCPHEECDKIFANKQSLKVHIRRLHNPDRKYPYKCSECEKGFHKKIFLKQHLYWHTGKAPFTCDKCEACFFRKSECNRHKRTHTEYSCECGNKFERWTALLLHKKTCEKCVPVCNICNSKFKNNAILKQHLKTHEDISERLVYTCTYEDCDKFYFYKKNLVQHELEYHKREFKKVTCPESNCRKVFNRKHNLKRHQEKVHSAKLKEKKVRKPRKDKGTSKKSTFAEFLGIKLPAAVEKGGTEVLEKVDETCSSSNLENSPVVTTTSQKDIISFVSDDVEQLELTTSTQNCGRNSVDSQDIHENILNEENIEDNELFNRCNKAVKLLVELCK